MHLIGHHSATQNKTKLKLPSTRGFEESHRRLCSAAAGRWAHFIKNEWKTVCTAGRVAFDLSKQLNALLVVVFFWVQLVEPTW